MTWLGPEKDQRECLEYAINNQNSELLSFLLEKVKLKPDLASVKTTASGKTLMHIAAEKGNDMAIYTIGSKLQTVDVREDGGNTPLHVAVAHKRNCTALYLFSLGADVNASNDRGMTPLHLAV